jgi:ABC-type uncharacterized transport system involved in gliding motility auxiliary subunit
VELTAMRRHVVARVLGALGSLLLVSTLVTFLFGNTQFVLGKALLGVLGLAAGFALGPPGGVRRFFAGRAAHYGFFTALSGLLLAVALVAANYAATRRPTSWDLTKGRIFTLSDDTVRTLEALAVDLKALAFYGPADPDHAAAGELLRRYAARSPRFSYELVDPFRRPELVRRHGITEGGPRIVLVRPDGAEAARVRSPDEQALTNGLVAATRQGRRRAYFTAGHGEPDPRDGSAKGYSRAVKALESEGFEVETLSLLERPAVPEDAALVVVAHARKAFLAPEVKALRAYWGGGGQLAILLEPELEVGLEGLLAELGVEASDDMVVDPSPVAQLFGGSPVTPVVAPTQHHAITRELAQTGLLFPTVRSLAARTGAPATPTPIALSGDGSWAETDVASLYGAGAKRDDGEKAGPLAVAMAVEVVVAPEPPGAGAAADAPPAPRRTARAVVSGDAEFFSNGYLEILGNRDFFLNLASWLGEQEDRITVRPRSREASRLFLTQAQASTIKFLTIDVLPVALLGAGLAVWLVRRSR